MNYEYMQNDVDRLLGSSRHSLLLCLVLQKNKVYFVLTHEDMIGLDKNKLTGFVAQEVQLESTLTECNIYQQSESEASELMTSLSRVMSSYKCLYQNTFVLNQVDRYSIVSVFQHEVSEQIKKLTEASKAFTAKTQGN